MPRCSGSGTEHDPNLRKRSQGWAQINLIAFRHAAVVHPCVTRPECRPAFVSHGARELIFRSNWSARRTQLKIKLKTHHPFGNIIKNEAAPASKNIYSPALLMHRPQLYCTNGICLALLLKRREIYDSVGPAAPIIC